MSFALEEPKLMTLIPVASATVPIERPASVWAMSRIIP